MPIHKNEIKSANLFPITNMIYLRKLFRTSSPFAREFKTNFGDFQFARAFKYLRANKKVTVKET